MVTPWQVLGGNCRQHSTFTSATTWAPVSDQRKGKIRPTMPWLLVTFTNIQALDGNCWLRSICTSRIFRVHHCQPKINVMPCHFNQRLWITISEARNGLLTYIPFIDQRKGKKKSDAALASNVGTGLICASGLLETSTKPTDDTTSTCCSRLELPGWHCLPLHWRWTVQEGVRL